MNFKEFKDKTKKWNVFSKVDILGSFNFMTTIVELNSIPDENKIIR